MSSRQRRLFEKQKDFLVASPERDEVSDDSAEDTSPVATSSANPYELLGGLAEASSSSENEPEEVLQDPPEEVGQGQKAAGSRRKKRNSKKKNKKAMCNEDDELDRLVRDIENAKGSESAVDDANGKSAPTDRFRKESAHDIFALSLKSLKGDEELNRMFGASVVADIEAELQRKRRQEEGRRGRGGGRRGERRFMRRFLLTDPQPEWSARESELTMISKGSVAGGELFEYVPSETYATIHDLFLECQNIGDPNMLSAFIAKHPFHVEALLAMHDVLTATGSHLHADECLNRALFALEAVWHRSFSPASGRCRLSFEVASNRHLFQGLFMHAHRLSKRGCLKTAFECSKFLLSLDTSDPLGVLCMIDYLAIRAGQFGFVENLIEALPDGPAIAVRPGFAFSLALSRYKQGRYEESIESLVQAVLMYPLALSRLTGKLKQTGTRLSHQYQTLLQHPFFGKATEDGSASLNHLINLFVERHHVLYKSQDVMDWLVNGAQIAHDCITKHSSFQGVTVEDWTCVRTAAFPPDDQNHFSHLHLYDFSDDVNRLPEDVLQGQGDEDAMADLERRMAQEIEQHGGIEGIVRLRQEDLHNANPLIAFLRSLLPWVQPEERNRGNPNDP